MEIRVLLRSIHKIIIPLLFLFAAVTAAMVLFLYAYIGKIGLTVAEDSHSYIGTVRSSIAPVPDIEEIPQNIIKELQDTGFLEEEDLRVTRSGSAEGLDIPVDAIMGVTLLDACVFIGTVETEMGSMTSERLCKEGAMVKIEHVFAGKLEPNKRTGTEIVEVQRKIDSDPILKRGARFLFVGVLGTSPNRVTATSVYTQADSTAELWEEVPEGSQRLEDNGVIPLDSKKSLDEAISDSLVILEERGYTDVVTVINSLSNRVTIRGTNNMDLLMPVVDGSMFFFQGRGITPEDADRKVCVISSLLASKNKLNVGDRIQLGCSDIGYTSDALCNDVAGIESGYPFLNDVDQAVQSPIVNMDEFEIIGIYNFAERNIFESYYLYSYDDIFIPSTLIPAGNQKFTARPYNYTFRVKGADYGAFLDAVENSLKEQGYELRMSDSDWPTVEEAYKEMKERQHLSMIGACACIAFAVLTYSLLLWAFFRKEFALRVLFGTPMRKARKSYMVPFFVTVIPACAFAVYQAYSRGVTGISEELAEFASGQMPVPSEILKMLILLAVAVFVSTYVVLQIILFIENRKSFQKFLE